MSKLVRLVQVGTVAAMMVGCGQLSPAGNLPVQPMAKQPALTQPMANQSVRRGPKASTANAQPGKVSAMSGQVSTYVEFEAGRLSFGRSEVANFLDRYSQYFDSYEFLQVKGGLLAKTYRVYIYGHNAQHVDYVADALWRWIDSQSRSGW